MGASNTALSYERCAPAGAQAGKPERGFDHQMESEEARIHEGEIVPNNPIRLSFQRPEYLGEIEHSPPVIDDVATTGRAGDHARLTVSSFHSDPRKFVGIHLDISIDRNGAVVIYPLALCKGKNLQLHPTVE